MPSFNEVRAVSVPPMATTARG